VRKTGSNRKHILKSLINVRMIVSNVTVVDT